MNSDKRICIIRVSFKLKNKRTEPTRNNSSLV